MTKIKKKFIQFLRDNGSSRTFSHKLWKFSQQSLDRHVAGMLPINYITYAFDWTGDKDFDHWERLNKEWKELIGDTPSEGQIVPRRMPRVEDFYNAYGK